ncbi:hypothetical protein GY45DRAFT_377369 [Cubamyces sp. BRFM 1775]|nr:hypothetical protein GY45DRAFT_377369 [Cubamyces sp. BRFM 1775]
MLMNVAATLGVARSTHGCPTAVSRRAPSGPPPSPSLPFLPTCQLVRGPWAHGRMGAWEEETLRHVRRRRRSACARRTRRTLGVVGETGETGGYEDTSTWWTHARVLHDARRLLVCELRVTTRVRSSRRQDAVAGRRSQAARALKAAFCNFVSGGPSEACISISAGPLVLHSYLYHQHGARAGLSMMCSGKRKRKHTGHAAYSRPERRMSDVELEHVRMYERGHDRRGAERFVEVRRSIKHEPDVLRVRSTRSPALCGCLAIDNCAQL